MTMEIDENKIKEFATNIFKNRENHEKQIKELLVKAEVCSKRDFFARYQEEMKNLESTPTKEQLTIEHFKDIFQTFDKYPANIQKRKKTTQKELNRTFFACKPPSLNDIAVNNSSNWEDGPPASEIYKNFRKFKQTLNTYLKQLEHKDLEVEYTKKLQKLNTLAKDVEKLYPADALNIEDAFTEQQKETLREFVENIESGLFIDSNRNLFKEEDQTMADTENLEIVMDYLSYWLNTVGQFNDM